MRRRVKAVWRLRETLFRNGKVISSYKQKKYGKKVKLSLCLTKHYAMKTYGGVDV
jgi:hypothetical protein